MLFLSDQDDFWESQKIEFKLNKFKNDKSIFLTINNATLTDSKLKKTKYTKLGQIKKINNNLNSFIQGSCICFNKELKKKILPFPEYIKTHDKWIVDFARHLKKILIVKESLQLYRIHGNNTSKFNLNKIYNKYLVNLRKIKKYDISIELKNEIKMLNEILFRIKDLRIYKEQIKEINNYKCQLDKRLNYITHHFLIFSK